MDTITLKKDMPGLPAGSVLTKDEHGIFRNGEHWVSQRWVDEQEEKLLALKEELLEKKQQVEEELASLEVKLK